MVGTGGDGGGGGEPPVKEKMTSVLYFTLFQLNDKYASLHHNFPFIKMELKSQN